MVPDFVSEGILQPIHTEGKNQTKHSLPGKRNSLFLDFVFSDSRCNLMIFKWFWAGAQCIVLP